MERSSRAPLALSVRAARSGLEPRALHSAFTSAGAGASGPAGASPASSAPATASPPSGARSPPPPPSAQHTHSSDSACDSYRSIESRSRREAVAVDEEECTNCAGAGDSRGWGAVGGARRGAGEARARAREARGREAARARAGAGRSARGSAAPPCPRAPCRPTRCRRPTLRRIDRCCPRLPFATTSNGYILNPTLPPVTSIGFIWKFRDLFLLIGLIDRYTNTL